MIYLFFGYVDIAYYRDNVNKETLILFLFYHPMSPILFSVRVCFMKRFFVRDDTRNAALATTSYD